MNINFLYITNLQYEVKSLKAQVEAFKSDVAYSSMKSDLMKQLNAKEREVKALKKELSDSYSAAAKMSNNWMQVNEDLQKECEKRIQVWIKRLCDMEKRALKAEAACDDWHDNKLR